MDKTWSYKKHIEIGGTMESVQQELLKKLSNQSSIDEIQNYIKKIMEMRGFNKEKSSDKILLLVEEVGELAKAIRKMRKS